MQKKWIYLNEGQHSDIADTLARQLNIEPLLAQVMVNRGITTKEQAHLFLAKDYHMLHDPFLLPDMALAVERISSAVASGEKITIYGDYDVDGITSTSILYLYLKSVGADVDYYIPDRMEEGYGVNGSALETIAGRGSTLVITVDCGITALEEAAAASRLGMDLIVTDHHTCQEELPDCVAVIDPKREDSCYPFSELAGVGVTFKLLCALSGDVLAMLAEYSDIVALGTVADIVSLQEENRILVSLGLEQMRRAPNMGIAALMKVAGCQQKTVAAGQIGFTIAPRLNAGGRMGSAQSGVTLLTADDEDQVAAIAEELNQVNKERQAEEGKTLKEAIELIEQNRLQEQDVIVVAKEGWHHGIVGIVASRIMERYYKSVIVVSLSGTEGKGSGRSIQGLNLFDALQSCRDDLLRFGGHAAAAGLSIATENLQAFRKHINAYAQSVLAQEDRMPKLFIDTKVKGKDFSLLTTKALAQLEPYGMGNRTPLFAAENAVVMDIRKLSEGKHVKFVLNIDGKEVDALFFSQGALADDYLKGDLVDAAGQFSENSYNGRTTVQLLLSDLRLHPAEEPLEEVPTREDFAAVYQYIRMFAKDGVYRDRAPLLCRRVSRGHSRKIGEGMLSNCLTIFQEMGLISRLEEDGLVLYVLPVKEKVNLEESRFYQNLKKKGQ